MCHETIRARAVVVAARAVGIGIGKSNPEKAILPTRTKT